jgi:hypothetical protein
MEPQPLTRAPRHRPALIGTALVVAAGLMTGGLLRAGDLFDAPPSLQALPAVAAGQGDDIVTYMMDADGHIPDYVIGTDVTAPLSEARFFAAAWAPDPAPAPADDWSTAPSMSGDILNVGTGASRDAQPAVAASVDSHAIDASEVAASGMTARVETKAAAQESAQTPTQAAADRRDGEAALASAGFTTQTP